MSNSHSTVLSTDLEAKTFSLNEAIAAESANRHSEATNIPQLSGK